MIECVPIDTTVRIWTTDTEAAVDRSGWMMLHVLVVNQTLHSAVTEDGEVTTVVIARTSQYRVNPEVSNFTVIVCVAVDDDDDDDDDDDGRITVVS